MKKFTTTIEIKNDSLTQGHGVGYREDNSPDDPNQSAGILRSQVG
jgi:hypothetical protein